MFYLSLIDVNYQTLSPKDAIGITDFNQFDLVVKQKSKILLTEVSIKQN